MPDPLPTFSHIIAHLASAFPSLAYISLIEPRVYGDFDSSDVDASHPAATFTPADSNDFARKILKEANEKNGPENRIRTRLIVGGGYSTDIKGAKTTAEENGDLVAFGRAFIANVSIFVRFSSRALSEPIL